MLAVIRRYSILAARWMGSVMTFLVCVGMVLVCILSMQGYAMYERAIKQKPVRCLVEQLRSDPSFVTIDQLPEIYVDAVVAVEDKRFWSHGGVDPLATARALGYDIFTLSFAQGGSTITQQLAKNQYFTQDKTLVRKFAEVFAAWELERCCTKAEILEMYVNTIYFGSGYEGISQAAKGYFGTTPAKLTDAQAVMLAGLPNAPSVYSLDENPTLARQRMRQVLDSMVKCRVTTEQRAQELMDQAP